VGGAIVVLIGASVLLVVVVLLVVEVWVVDGTAMVATNPLAGVADAPRAVR
jgi:hypothetical protein